jgi:hypothetical protein
LTSGGKPEICRKISVPKLELGNEVDFDAGEKTGPHLKTFRSGLRLEAKSLT